MTYKFAKVRKYGMDYPWMLVIDNLDDLIRYESRALSHEKLAHFLHEGYDGALGKSHPTTPIGTLVEMKLLAGAGNRNISALEAVGSIANEIILAKRRILREYGKIYINAAGGFFYHTPDIKILDEMEVDKLVFPCFNEEDIRISQWPNGEHWYAYVGEFQVVDSKGNNKWDTKEEAHKEAEHYIYYANRQQFIPKVNHPESYVYPKSNKHGGIVSCE